MEASVVDVEVDARREVREIATEGPGTCRVSGVRRNCQVGSLRVVEVLCAVRFKASSEGPSRGSEFVEVEPSIRRYVRHRPTDS